MTTAFTSDALHDLASDMEDALATAADMPAPFRASTEAAIHATVADRLRELIDPPVKVRGAVQPASEFVLGRVTGRVRETVDALPVGSRFTDKMGDGWEVVAEGLLKVIFRSGNTRRMFTQEAFDLWPWSFSEITLTKVGA